MAMTKDRFDYKRWELRMAWDMTFMRNLNELGLFGTFIDEPLLRQTLNNVAWRPQITGLLLYLTLHMCHTGEAEGTHPIINKFMEVSPMFHQDTIVFTTVFFDLAIVDAELFVSRHVSMVKERATLYGVLQHLHPDVTVKVVEDQVVHQHVANDCFLID
jgi:hypothetical protein